jgi:hypothetical protein
MGLVLSPYLYLIGCEIYDCTHRDGSETYRLKARSTNSNLSEWDHILSGDN